MRKNFPEFSRFVPPATKFAVFPAFATWETDVTPDFFLLSVERAVKGIKGRVQCDKLTFGGANSLDHYFARPDGAVDWLRWSDEVAAVMDGYWKTIDTVLMGRKTYEFARQHSGETGGYPGMKSYVFSRTLADDPDETTRLVREDAAAFVRRLKEEDGKDICLMGGGDLARTLFEAGLIDDVGFNIHPVLLGSGSPVFHPMSRQIDLELMECKTFKNCCVLVTYRVKN